MIAKWKSFFVIISRSTQPILTIFFFKKLWGQWDLQNKKKVHQNQITRSWDNFFCHRIESESSPDRIAKILIQSDPCRTLLEGTWMDRTLKVFFKVLLVIFFNETFYSRFVFLFFCRLTASLVSPFMGSWIFLGRISKLFFEIS